MRVAYDVGPLLDPPTGVGRYTRELATSLEAMDVDLVRFAVALRGQAGPEVARWRLPARSVQWAWRKFGIPPIDRLVGQMDLVHATNFVLPALRRARGVVTVHDLSFYRDDTFPGGERLRDLVPWSVGRAHQVLVPSDAVGDEVRDRFGLPSERVSVTPEGVAALFFGATPLAASTLERFGIRQPFALAVGTIEPRKNLVRLLQAWRAAADALKEWTLVLAGPPGWGPEIPRTPRVVPIGWVGDETLPGLFAAASFFCYPSLYEGFGLPPLEAMAAGTPVVAGRYSAAPEVLADAALLVEPKDVDAWAGALERLAQDEALRRSLARAGRSRAAGFSWQSTGAATLRAYDAALRV